MFIGLDLVVDIVRINHRLMFPISSGNQVYNSFLVPLSLLFTRNINNMKTRYEARLHIDYKSWS